MPLPDMTRLTVVIPAYNEGSRLPATLRQILDYLGNRRSAFEIVVVDDGSRDGTAQLAEGLLRPLGNRGRVFRHETNAGKGASVRRGMLVARGERVLFSDADLSTPIEEVEKLEAALGAGAQIAIGSRAIDRTLVERRQNAVREASGRVFNWLVRSIAVGGIRDTQCGFKLFTREVLEPIFSQQRLDGFGFDIELLAIAQRLGFPIAEVPVRWLNNPDSRVGVLRGAATFIDPFRVRLGLLCGYYDQVHPVSAVRDHGQTDHVPRRM